MENATFLLRKGNYRNKDQGKFDLFEDFLKVILGTKVSKTNMSHCDVFITKIELESLAFISHYPPK